MERRERVMQNEREREGERVEGKYDQVKGRSEGKGCVWRVKLGQGRKGERERGKKRERKTDGKIDKQRERRGETSKEIMRDRQIAKQSKDMPLQTQTDTIARKTTDIEKQRGTDRIDRQKDRNR